MGEIKHIGLRVAYDGAAFEGFQYQKSGKSIQESLESALAKSFKFKGRILFSSRTDSGVHALDQFIVLPNFFPEFARLPQNQKDRFLTSLNYHLGPSIQIWKAVGLREGFNLKTDLLWKEYRYRILNSFFEDPLEMNRSLWIRRDLDIDLMNREAKSLIGKHDFAGFAKSSAKDLKNFSKGSIREVLKAEFKKSKHSRFDAAYFLEFRIQARGFLHHMVRNIVGTLVDIGLGKDLKVSKILKNKDRQLAGPNVPPEALCLVRTQLKSKCQVPLGLPND